MCCYSYIYRYSYSYSSTTSTGHLQCFVPSVRSYSYYIARRSRLSVRQRIYTRLVLIVPRKVQQSPAMFRNSVIRSAADAKDKPMAVLKLGSGEGQPITSRQRN